METITQRVTTDEPVVLLRVKDYIELLDKVEDNYLEMLYKIFGTMYEYGKHYKHVNKTDGSFTEHLQAYIEKQFPYLIIGYKGEMREGTQRLTVKYNHKWRQLEKGQSEDGADTGYTQESKGEV